MVVLDTNIISEALRPAPDHRVCRWLSQQELTSVHTTSILIAESLAGFRMMPEGRRRADLEAAFDLIVAHAFPGRILAFDEAAARTYGQIFSARRTIGRRIQQADAMIAAICRGHRAALATRNTPDFEHCGIQLVNPWNHTL